MPLYVLDTDTLTLFREGQAQVCDRVSRVPGPELATSVITLEEQLTGWYTLLRQARRPDQIERAYRRLAETVQWFAGIQVLVLTQEAIARYEELASLRLNVGKMDLRIAAITLVAGGTVVTRNVRDFRRVPGLPVEDWTQPQVDEDGTDTCLSS